MFEKLFWEILASVLDFNYLCPATTELSVQFPYHQGRIASHNHPLKNSFHFLVLVSKMSDDSMRPQWSINTYKCNWVNFVHQICQFIFILHISIDSHWFTILKTLHKKAKKTYLLKPFIWLSKRTPKNIGKFSFMCKLEREDVPRDIQCNKVQSAHHAKRRNTWYYVELVCMSKVQPSHVGGLNKV
jgi:hypothetical protein